MNSQAAMLLRSLDVVAAPDPMCKTQGQAFRRLQRLTAGLLRRKRVGLRLTCGDLTVVHSLGRTTRG